jgi:PAS domain S-box-containing protein
MSSNPDLLLNSAGLPFRGADKENGDFSNDFSLPISPADVLERIPDAFVILDKQWRIVYANLRASEINKKPLSEFVGKTLWEEWPAAISTEIERQYRKAVAEMVDVHFVHNYADDKYDVWLEIDAYPSEHGLSLFYRDVSDRKHTELALMRSREDLQLAIDAARIGTFYCDWPLDKIIWNETCKGHFFLPPDAEVDFNLFYSLLHPEDREPTRLAIEHAMASRTTYDVEYRALSQDGRSRWINAVGRFYYDNGVPIRFDGITHDISERKNSHYALQQANSRTTRILESITDAFFTLDNDWRFTYVNAEAECVLRIAREEILGRALWEVFPGTEDSRFAAEYKRAMDEGVPIYLEEYSRTLGSWLEVRAYPSADGLSAFFQNVDARKAVEIERERLLTESVAHAAREAFLKRIANALRSPDPDRVQEEVVKLLGLELKADRCYFATYDLGRTRVVLGSDYHRESLPPIRGEYNFPNTAEMYHELYRASNVSAIEDAYTAPISDETRANMRLLDVRSRISAALADSGGLMTTLTVAMSDTTRRWTPEEAALVEAVAVQLRSGMDVARTVQREHNIAVRLQSALQPDLPASVQGLALSKFYRAALVQSEGVGGDFFDVFGVDSRTTALIVGDLSGKGLAAAAQVSTVRNMLRAFLYSLPTVEEAVRELNRILVQNSLITGFTTLFVGLYDSESCLLRYVSCGQEPALVRRRGTQTIEFLEETGAVVGAIEDAEFCEAETTLLPGDVLAMFTDGLTEVGASRSDLLGVEGVAKLLRGCELQNDDCPRWLADSVTAALIDGVDNYAQSGLRDDMCLLVAVAL